MKTKTQNVIVLDVELTEEEMHEIRDEVRLLERAGHIDRSGVPSALSRLADLIAGHL